MSAGNASEGRVRQVGEPDAARREDADPGQVLRYRLDLPDALAWERVSPAHRRRDRLALMVSVFAGMALVQFGGSHIESASGLHSLPVALGLLILPPLLVRLLQVHDRRRRARERVGDGDGVEVVLEVQRDRLVERRADRAAVLAIGARSLREVREGPGYVFLATREDVVILPARAVGGDTALREFAARWRAKAS